MSTRPRYPAQHPSQGPGMDFHVAVEHGPQACGEGPDRALARMRLTSVRLASVYGLVQRTATARGCALEALVALGETAAPGVVIRCRAVAVLRTRLDGPAGKILCVPVGDPLTAHYATWGTFPTRTGGRSSTSSGLRGGAARLASPDLPMARATGGGGRDSHLPAATGRRLTNTPGVSGCPRPASRSRTGGGGRPAAASPPRCR
ncbi:hypothetical protein GXW82_33120 [Streptacidiphilus sp. 4-A2]|nr:hypothetical protein [Streptacidiphilus sp. 4-A2]